MPFLANKKARHYYLPRFLNFFHLHKLYFVNFQCDFDFFFVFCFFYKIFNNGNGNTSHKQSNRLQAVRFYLFLFTVKI